MEYDSSQQLNYTPNVIYTNTEGSSTDHLLEIVALGLVLIFSTLLNVILVGLALLKKLTSSPDAETLVVAFCLHIAVDSIVNISFALSFLSFWSQKEPPEVVCRLSATLYFLFLATHPLYVVAHFVRVFLRRKKTTSELPIGIHLANVLFPSAFAAIFALPILILPFLVNVQLFTNRYACGIAADSWVLTVVLVVFNLLPTWGILVFCLILRLIQRPSHLAASTPTATANDDGFAHLTPLAVATVFFLLPAVATFATIDNESGVTDKIAAWSRLLFNVICSIVIFASFNGARIECQRIFSSASHSPFTVNGSIRKSKNLRTDGGPVLFVASDGLVLKQNGSSPTLMRRCDLFDISAAVSSSSISPQVQHLRPSSASSSFKKRRKNKTRKVVRFAQSVKEIPLDA